MKFKWISKIIGLREIGILVRLRWPKSVYNDLKIGVVSLDGSHEDGKKICGVFTGSKV